MGAVATNVVLAAAITTLSIFRRQAGKTTLAFYSGTDERANRPKCARLARHLFRDQIIGSGTVFNGHGLDGQTGSGIDFKNFIVRLIDEINHGPDRIGLDVPNAKGGLDLRVGRGRKRRVGGKTRPERKKGDEDESGQRGEGFRVGSKVRDCFPGWIFGQDPLFAQT